MTGRRDPPRQTALWYGLLGAPVAWSLQLVVGYAIVALRCRAAPAAGDAAPLAAIVVSAALFAVAVGSLATARANWRRSPPEREGADITRRATTARVRFMSVSGIFVAAVFVIGIAFGSAALLVLDPCR